MSWKTFRILLIGFIGLQLAGTLLYPTTRIRFRVTVNVETPAGLKSGSSVMDSVFSRHFSLGGLFNPLSSALDGEAVFVDLGTSPDGKSLNIVALLTWTKRRDLQYAPMLASSDFLKANRDAREARSRASYQLRSTTKVKGPAFNCGEFGDAVCEIAQRPVGTRETLQGDLIPTLVTLRDPNDPKSALVVSPDSLHGAFGPGFHLRDVTLEFADRGSWPLNMFGIGGEPLTHTIEARLPAMMDTLRRQRSNIWPPPGSPLILRIEYLKQDG